MQKSQYVLFFFPPLSDAFSYFLEPIEVISWYFSCFGDRNYYVFPLVFTVSI